MSLAVAMRKIGLAMVLHPGEQRAEHPLREAAVGRSLLAEAKAFSISSIQKTTGAMASACCRASRRRASVSPTNFW